LRLRERFSLASLLSVPLLILAATTAWAADADLDGKARALDKGVKTSAERSAFFTKFGIPPTSPFNTLPSGQALVLWSLCGNSSNPGGCETQALNDRKAHMGWGKVAQDLNKNGFTTTDKVGEAVRQVTEAHRDLVAKNEKDGAEKLTKKVDKVEKVNKPERIERVERPERPERPGR